MTSSRLTGLFPFRQSGQKTRESFVRLCVFFWISPTESTEPGCNLKIKMTCEAQSDPAALAARFAAANHALLQGQLKFWQNQLFRNLLFQGNEFHAAHQRRSCSGRRGSRVKRNSLAAFRRVNQ